MFYSFLATNIYSKDLFAKISEKSSRYCRKVDEAGWSLLFKSTLTSPENLLSYSDGQETYYIIGEIDNINELRTLLAAYSSNSLSCNAAQLLYILRKSIGEKAFSLVEGSFTLLISSINSDLTVVTDSLGKNPVHIVFDNQTLWITSELKNVGLIRKDVFDFQEENKLTDKVFQSDNFLPIKNAIRVKPGQIIYAKNDGNGYPYLTYGDTKLLSLGNDQSIDKNLAITFIDQLLKNSVYNCINNSDTNISLPLSGGLDSSLVTALACQKRSNLTTYSIGTEENNEFLYSKIVSKHLGTKHKEFLLSDEDVLTGIIEAIYYNEIFDGLSAEIQSGLFNLYKFDSGFSNTMLTGYGSDLLFGGILNTDCELSRVNPLLWQQIYRTRWTGEFSPFGAIHYGIKVRHPFWTTRLISFCMNLDPSLKISSYDVKMILREYAENLQLLPKEIVWRKKIGIHEGSSVNSVFAKMIGVNVSNYRLKTKFTYNLYKKFITGQLQVNDVNLRQLIKGEA